MFGGTIGATAGVGGGANAMFSWPAKRILSRSPSPDPDLEQKIAAFEHNHPFPQLCRIWPISLAMRKIYHSEDTRRLRDLEDLELQTARYRPESLSQLEQITKFTRKELQTMYRGFKQECPSGIVTKETFKDIYCRFFPLGDATSYAGYVFNTFDTEDVGSITFEEFVVALSLLSRGSLEERLQWAFRLYDMDADGKISREEMTEIVAAVYEMMGASTTPKTDANTVLEHVDMIFEKLDTNQDGVITMDEFMQVCQHDEGILFSVNQLDTIM